MLSHPANHTRMVLIRLGHVQRWLLYPSDFLRRAGWQRMCLLVLCLKPENLLDPNDSFRSFSGRLTISPVVERLVFSKARRRHRCLPECVCRATRDIIPATNRFWCRILRRHMCSL